MRQPLFQLGVSFIQIGDDDEASRHLASLDDDLKVKHRIRDFVDTTPYQASQGASLFSFRFPPLRVPAPGASPYSVSLLVPRREPKLTLASIILRQGTITGEFILKALLGGINVGSRFLSSHQIGPAD